MILKGRCPHCGGLVYYDTESQRMAIVQADLDQFKLDIVEKVKESHPEVDQGEGPESPDDLTKPWTKDDFSKNDPK